MSETSYSPDREAFQAFMSPRPSDGYVNATRMCLNGGEDLNEYLTLEETKGFIAVLVRDEKVLEGNAVKHEKSCKDGLEEVWVHELLAINLAMWVSPHVAALVSCVIYDHIAGATKH